MPKFGNENENANQVNTEDDIRGSYFTCPANGTLDSIVAYISYSGGIPCLLGSNIIKTKKGNMELSNISIGDEILTYDEDLKVLKYNKVKIIEKYNTREYLIINKKLKLTSNHFIYVNDNWIRTKNLKIGDYLLTSDSKKEAVETIEEIKDNIDVYELSIDGNCNFFCSNYLVHNADEIKAAIYKKSDYSLVASSDEETSSEGWITFTGFGSPSLISSTDYYLVVWADSTTAMVGLCYSDTDSIGIYRNLDYDVSSGDYPDPLEPDDTENYTYCIYANYTGVSSLYLANSGRLSFSGGSKKLSFVAN